MLIPVGVDSQKLKCVYVQNEGVGFWLYSLGARLLGEAKLLEDAKQALQQFELNSTWLQLEICENEFNILSVEILADNPTKLEPDALAELSNDKEKLKLEIEYYVRTLMNSFSLSHPTLKKYRERIGKLYLDNRVFNLQKMVTFAALKCRHVDIKDIEVSTDDPQIGFVSGLKVSKGEITIGLPHLNELDVCDSPFISETLNYLLYQFANSEHNGINWLTDKMVATNNDKASEVNPVATSEGVEKKDVI